MEMSKIALAIISLISLAIVHHAHAQDSPQDFLDAHNTARASVGVGHMIWDDTVAAFALSYINGLKGSCIMEHSTGSSYGENLAGGSTDLAGTAAVEMWVAERENYDYDSNSCVGGECLHYTQVVWSNSVRLGCAKSCRSAEMTVVFRLNYQKETPSNCSNIYAAASDQPNRLEIDFEFLANVSGQPYILQTNVYADANCDREERIYLWFDPTNSISCGTLTKLCKLA
ncbi:hypothetical protein SADUNF_Sadunf16G0172000 [Salix dunnii]|uniref:SCP domain-containing protein n=1 Tax=Salix dunnii TaxID=1413687 RepID=A0A835JAN3_9ROSI|nr:hypothetical protein SADUNF_Sadunf16G0172000 [Salix dunnii]